VLLIAALLFVVQDAQEAAAVQLTKTFTITTEDLDNASADFFNMTFAIGGARVTVDHSDNSSVVLRATVTYDDFGPEPKLDMSSDNSTGFWATLSSGYETAPMVYYIPFPQRWNVVLGSYGVPTDLTVLGGGIETVMDFGGMPLRRADFTLGGVSAFLNFSIPTTRRVESFSVACGGIDLEIDNIANTDFQRFSLTGGGSMANLDFRGTYASPDHSVRIIGAGSLISIAVPDTAGESLTALSAGGLTLVRGSGWRRFPNFCFYKEFETTDYDDAAARLDFELITAGALVTVKRN
jgi:hypothetical protein